MKLVDRSNGVVLYRNRDPNMSTPELAAANAHFTCIPQRTAIEAGDLVIPRYCYLPYPRSLQDDCEYVGASLINPLHQHYFAADARNWGEVLGNLTPRTWYRLEDVDEPGPYILKGATNSRKFDWNTHCFAADIAAAKEVEWRLYSDGLIGGGSQNVYVRKYVPLKTFMTGINGLPVTNEYRFFVAFGTVLCGAYYWSNYVDDLPAVPKAEEVPESLLRDAVSRVGRSISFYSLDVAQTAEGGWIVIEINDGCMSGLSENNPEMLYARLSDRLRMRALESAADET